MLVMHPYGLTHHSKPCHLAVCLPVYCCRTADHGAYKAGPPGALQHQHHTSTAVPLRLWHIHALSTILTTHHAGSVYRSDPANVEPQFVTGPAAGCQAHHTKHTQAALTPNPCAAPPYVNMILPSLRHSVTQPSGKRPAAPLRAPSSALLPATQSDNSRLPQ